MFAVRSPMESWMNQPAVERVETATLHLERARTLPRLRARNFLRHTGVALLATAGILSAALASGEQTISNVTVAKDEIDPASPSNAGGSLANPVLVLRNNPTFHGVFATKGSGISGSASGKYSADGVWNGLTGDVKVYEHNANGTIVATQLDPMMPGSGVSASPGAIPWQSRSGSVVSGNTYEVSVQAKGANGQTFGVSQPLFVRLSDKVPVVPVVVISWRRPDDPQNLDHTNIAKNLFDFLPYFKPPFAPSEIRAADVIAPNVPGVRRITAPDSREIPPDEIYAQCGVQFEVVASYVFDVRPGFNPTCNENTTVFATLDEVRTKVRAAAGALGPALVDKLQPLFVAYGRMGCSSFNGNSAQSGLAEIDSVSGRKVTTAHEMGHTLIQTEHETSGGHPVLGNLMRAGPETETALTPKQCERAQFSAKAYATRFNAFNVETGRVSAHLLTPLANAPPVLIVPKSVCCQPPSGPAFTTDTKTCKSAGGSETTTTTCTEACCLSGADVAIKPKDQCKPASQVDKGQCSLICCSKFGDKKKVTVHQCSAASGKEILCGAGPS